MSFIKNTDIQKNKRGYIMQYYNENYDVEAEKSKKWSTLVLVLIVLTIIAIIAVACTMLYIQQRAFRVYINGASVNLPKDILIMN